MRKALFIALSILCIGLSACDRQRIYEKNIDFEERIWIYDSVPSFTFEIKDTAESYNLYYNIRNSLDYPFHNLYLNYALKDSTEVVLSTELNDISLFDVKTGAPKGDGLGDIFDHQVMFLDAFKFKKTGMYEIEIQQFMRRDSLPEIMSLGLRVEKHEMP